MMTALNTLRKAHSQQEGSQIFKPYVRVRIAWKHLLKNSFAHLSHYAARDVRRGMRASGV
jgi:hypothetical protein